MHRPSPTPAACTAARTAWRDLGEAAPGAHGEDLAPLVHSRPAYHAGPGRPVAEAGLSRGPPRSRRPRGRSPPRATSRWVTSRRVRASMAMARTPSPCSGGRRRPGRCGPRGWPPRCWSATGVTCTPRPRARASPRSRAFGRGPRRGGERASSRATRPAAARTPAWRMPPPRSLRARRAFSMRSRDEATSEPTGAAEPLGQAGHDGVGAGHQGRRRDPEGDRRVPDPGPVHVDAEAASRAAAITARVSAAPSTVPPARLWVFSRTTRRHVGLVVGPGRHRGPDVLRGEVAARERPPCAA